MRVLIAGGGTGGHLFPGLAVAEELVARGLGRKDDIAFAGTARGIEARVVPREGFPLELIDVGGLKGGGAVHLARGLLRLPRALLQSMAILRRRRPDLVVGVGGYASGPLVVAAWLLGLPTAILEQNSVPGVTNRLLARLVRAVFASFEESGGFFPPGKVRVLGTPIRAALRGALAVAAQEGRANAEQRSLLVLGGSQGARAVNQLVADAIAEWQEGGVLSDGGALAGLHIVHQSGPADVQHLASRYAALGAPVTVTPFIDDMAAAYVRADLVIARAGATTIAELTAIGRAAILVPLPTAADDHQTINARSLERRGAALLLPQAEATGASLAAAARALLTDDPRRLGMERAARSLGRPDAASAIVDQLVTLC